MSDLIFAKALTWNSLEDAHDTQFQILRWVKAGNIFQFLLFIFILQLFVGSGMVVQKRFSLSCKVLEIFF